MAVLIPFLLQINNYIADLLKRLRLRPGRGKRASLLRRVWLKVQEDLTVVDDNDQGPGEVGDKRTCGKLAALVKSQFRVPPNS